MCAVVLQASEEGNGQLSTITGFLIDFYSIICRFVHV